MIDQQIGQAVELYLTDRYELRQFYWAVMLTIPNRGKQTTQLQSDMLKVLFEATSAALPGEAFKNAVESLWNNYVEKMKKQKQ